MSLQRYGDTVLKLASAVYIVNNELEWVAATGDQHDEAAKSLSEFVQMVSQ